MSYDSNWSNVVGEWLTHSAVFGAIILILGGAAVALIRQPVYRIRIIQWTLAACLAVPLLQQLPGLPGYSLPVWTTASDAPTAAPVTIADPVEYAGSYLPPLDVVPTEMLGAEPQSPTAVAPQVAANEANPPPAVASATAVAASAWPLRLPNIRALLLGTYFVIVAGYLVHWSLGWSRRRQILQSAKPADETIRSLLTSIAGPAAQRARLLVSDQVAAPMMWGVVRPVIVVPASLVRQPDQTALRWGLAHEWSHVVHGDFSRHLLASVTKLVCFYQPAYWWLRRQLTLSQDYLADAFAAQQGESPEDYAAFLVALARSGQRPQLAGTLGIGGHRSNLFRRVSMLVQSTRPLLLRNGRWPTLAIASLALLASAGLSAVRLGAEPVELAAAGAAGSEPLAEQDQAVAQPAAAAAPPEKSPLPDPITYVGKVVDRETGQPIAGATVEIIRSLSRHPKTDRWEWLHTTKHVSNEQGEYQFTLPPEEVAEPSLYLEVDAHHEQYQSKGRSGYSHMMIRKNLENGEPPFYSTIKLAPGEPITAVVLQPDGKPSANTQVLVYSKSPAKQPGRSFEFGAFQHTQTDEQGRLRVVVATPGDGVLWVFPKNFSPLAHRLRDIRGDLGSLQLTEGTRLSGRVLDAKGNPVAGVGVNLRRNGDGDDADEFLGSNAVANAIGTGALTDDQGRFELNPLPPGTYRAEVDKSAENSSEPRKERPYNPDPLEHVFVPLEITIRGGEIADPIEIRAVPHVVLRGRFFDSQGQPRASHQQHVFGRANGEGYFANSTVPGKDGWFEFKLPHGVENVELRLSTNEHSSLRWRLKPDEPLTYGRRIQWERLDQDFTTLEVVRYEAPLLLLKAVDDNGEQIKGFIPTSHYAKPAVEEGSRFISGAQGDIGFEEQPDGRWRSSQLLPDENLKVTLSKDGYADTEPQTVSLKEGEIREVVFVLKKAPPAAEK